MGCSNQKFKTAEASSKARLRTKGIIDEYLNIIDYNQFVKHNNAWTADARARFKIDGKLFYTEGNKAMPNKKAFKAIDKAKGIYYQLNENNATAASPATVKLIKEFLQRSGVDIKTVDKILYKGKPIGAQGVANVTKALVQVIQGKEATALPEEAMHFAVELIQMNDPALFKQLLKEINSYVLYDKVIADYGNNPVYKTKDGKRDILKLKKEAIAQVLSETIIHRNDNNTGELNTNLAKVGTWWEKILNAIKNFFMKSGFDKAAMDIIAGKSFGTAQELRQENDELFFQLDNQTRIFNTFKERGKQIKLQKDPNSKSKDQREYYFIGDRKIKQRVSDLVHDWYGRVFANKGLLDTEYDTAVKDLKAEKGSLGHKDLEYALSLFVDENGFLKPKTERDVIKDNDTHVSLLDPNNRDLYIELRDNLENRLVSYGEGTRFMSEQIIYDSERDIAGTVDFIAIEKDGTVNILDWKFMDLNIDKYDDIPWYKVNGWNQQMEQYKYIMSKAYGIKMENFRHTRMIPIKAYYSKGNKFKNIKPSLLNIQIGDVDVQNITEDYLLPVGLENETTGDDRIDVLLEKLNAVYKKLSEGKALPSERTNKSEQLNALFKAIRQLQIKQNISPLIRQAKILKVQIDRIISKHDQIFTKGLDAKGKPIYKDANIYEEDEISDMANSIENATQAIEVYIHLEQELGFLFIGKDSKEDKELKTDLSSTVTEARDSLFRLKEIDKNFTDNIIGKSEKIENLSNPEKIVKGAGWLFGTAATIQLKSLQTLYRKANRVFGFAAMETRDEINKLQDIRKEYIVWAKAKGLTPENYFNIIKKEGKNELIDEYNSEFYTEFGDRAEALDYKWIRDNIEVDEYKAYLAEKLKEEIQRIKDKPRIGTYEESEVEVNKEIQKAKDQFGTSLPNSYGWLRNDAKKFPKRSKWESEEWKNLHAKDGSGNYLNAPAVKFYEYILERNEYYKSIGYIHSGQARVFLPWVRKSLSEKLVFGGNVTMGEQFLRNITVAEGELGYGQINPLTGKAKDVIPIMLTTKLDTDYSTDLFKTMGLYNEFAIKFKYLSTIEAQARALLRLENNKKAIATSMFGKTEYKNGVIQYTPDNHSNAQLVEDMIKAIIYQQKYITSESFDQVLGHVGKQGKKINKFIGFKLFPEDLEGRTFSVNKSISQINNSYQVIALGWNFLSATSNLFGGKTQAFINSGRYFTKAQFFQTELWLLSNKMNGSDKKKHLAALEYFMPFTDNFNREANNKLSIAKLTQEGVQDWLMVLMRNSDQAVQTTNFFAYIKNSIVMNGDVVNAREYLRTLPEYEDMYAGTEAERTARADKFEKDAEKIIAEKGVLKLGSVNDKGEFIIPGVDRMSESIIELRRKVQQFTSDALGNLSEEQKRKINMSVYGKSAMVFKSWIPRLVDVRVGNLKYNAASDAYEWGRTRMFMKILMEDHIGSLKTLLNTIKGNDAGIERMRKLYESKKADYEADTGKTLDMTESEFITLATQNLQNQVWDSLFYAGLFALGLVVQAVAPGDDEDPRILNMHRFGLKAVDKLTDEIGYFYNPANLFKLVQRGIFPATGLIENYIKVAENFGEEMYGFTTGDDEIVEKNHVIKYVMKSFPLTSQAQALLPMLAPEVAKDLGIKMRSNYGR